MAVVFILLFLLLLLSQGTQATGYINGKQAFSTKVSATPNHGFVAIGTRDFAADQYWFDNFSLTSAS